MTIYYWTNFSKRKNSTKRPSGTGTSKTVVLKEGTSIERPTFVFSSNDFTINYIQAFGHYYFVDDIKSVRNDLIEVSCSMDVLATFKTEIGSYTAFIERSATHINSLIPDPYVTMLNSETLQENSYSVTDLFTAGGVYIISVLNNLGSGAGFTTYYMTDKANIMALAAYVNTDWGSAISPGSDETGATNRITDWLQATFLKTADSIIDCIWVPFNLPSPPVSFASQETLKIGVDSVSGVTGYRFTSPGLISESYTVSIPHYYSDFRKGAPYTVGKMFLPGFGIVDFNPLDFGGDTITVTFDADYTTGDVMCYFKDLSGKIISTYSYNVAVSCPVGKVSANAAGTAGGILSTLGSVATAIASEGGKAVSAGVAAISGAANTLATAVAPSVSVHGAKGGRAIINNGLDLICTTISKLTTQPSDLGPAQGRMSMGRAALSSCSGYVRCSDASIEIAGMESEKDAVNNFLNSGFYYE